MIRTFYLAGPTGHSFLSRIVSKADSLEEQMRR